MKKLVWLLMIAGLVSVANAADIRYRGSGAWQNISDGTSPGWINPTLPGTADYARANWGGNEITLDYAAPTVRGFQAGVDESGTFHILNGGTLTSGGGTSSKIGNNTSNVTNAPVTGRLIIDAGGLVQQNNLLTIAGSTGALTGIVDVSGTLNVTGHLWMATGGVKTGLGTAVSTAYMDIYSGGVVNVGGMLGLGTGNATSASGGVATLTVHNGGILNLAQIHAGILNATGSSIWGDSVLKILEGGKVTKTANFVSVLQAYIDAGKITTDYADGLTVTYDAGTNLTTIVPEPATMALLGLGALALLRKRK